MARPTQRCRIGEFSARLRPIGGKLINTIVQVVIGGAIVFAIGVWLGRVGVIWCGGERNVEAAVRKMG